LVLERQRATCLTRVPPAQEIQAALTPLITFAPYSDYADVVRQVVGTTATTVWLDPSGTTMGTRLLLPEGQRVHSERNPVVLLKALKNANEIASSRAAHQHAAAAKIRSLARLDRLRTSGQPVSERAYAEILHEEYSQEEGFHDLSFPTISAAGAN